MVQAAKTKGITPKLLSDAIEYSNSIIAGINASPSHFHAVNYCKSLLASNDFVELKETEQWSV